MTYNMSMIGNSTGYLGFLQNINSELMFGWFGISILITIVSISFISFMSRNGDASKAFASSMFIGFGLALLLRVMDLVPDIAIYITLICTAGSVVLLKNN